MPKNLCYVVHKAERSQTSNISNLSERMFRAICGAARSIYRGIKNFFAPQSPPVIRAETAEKVSRIDEVYSSRDAHDREMEEIRESTNYYISQTRQRDEAYQSARRRNREAQDRLRRAEAQAQLEEEAGRHVEEATRRVREATALAREEADRARRERERLIEQNWGRRPTYLRENSLSVGFFGRAGTGKTSLWNTLNRTLFRQLVPREQWENHRENFRRHAVGAVGALETTQSVAHYQIPTTIVNMIDNPGHGTVRFSSTEYVRHFGVGYYHKRLYVYSGRLLEPDVRMIFTLIYFGVEFVLVRQKFEQDLKSFAKSLYETNVSNEDPFAEDQDEAETNFIRAKLVDQSFVADCRDRLKMEFKRNFENLIDDSPSEIVRNEKELLMSKEFKFYCVDSQTIERYDGSALVQYLFTEAESSPIIATGQ